MKILVIGGGGREHALSWKLAQSKNVDMVFVAPGNPGTALEPKVQNIPYTTIPELIDFVSHHQIDFTVVGPEIPLANGIVDDFKRHNFNIWGPTQFCAQLESSKVFAKNFMTKYRIPTANYQTFDNAFDANAYLQQQTLPIVIKADGLAAGKGVLIAYTLSEAVEFINQIFTNNKFGDAGNTVVIEEYLNGTEISFIVMIDGVNILPLASSQDHKRLLNNDCGPNTGGMGAYSPLSFVNQELTQRIIREIIQPVINGFKQEGHVYSGFLYAGLMIDNQGNPKTLEFNCRLGDPETQVLMFRLQTDLVSLIQAGFTQKLNTVTTTWDNNVAIGVVLASEGYPDKYTKDVIIDGLNQIDKDLKVFHAATKVINNAIYTAGGRVMCLVGSSNDILSTQNKVYQVINLIQFHGKQYRTDIGNKGI